MEKVERCPWEKGERGRGGGVEGLRYRGVYRDFTTHTITNYKIQVSGEASEFVLYTFTE